MTLDWLPASGRFGELSVERTPAGFELRTAGPPAYDVAPGDLFQWARTDARGRYRPLTGARSLCPGLRCLLADERALEDAVESVYPLAITHTRQAAVGTLATTSLDSVLERQSGRYESARSLSPRGRTLTRTLLCGQCVRTPVWHTVSNPDGAIPCPEPCSVYVALAREAAAWEQDPPDPSPLDDAIPFAAFERPGNPLRETYLHFLAQTGPMDNAHTIEAARSLFPGGVNSPVRSFKSVGGAPVPITRGEGPHVFDVEGRRYVDFIGAFGPLILGHAQASIVEAVTRAAQSGLAFGATSPGELELGRRITDATGLERVRFLNSGTEATMTAIRIARAATGRPIVVKFEGGYHGHSDGLLARAGSGVATFAVSDSAGVPPQIAGQTAVLPMNDVAALETYFAEHGDETAAVIVESIPANMGVVPLTDAFREALQRVPREHGAALIADEVITGFRLRYGLSGELPGADLVCLGKIIGGGLPIGAVGGSERLMSLLAPEGPVYQAGTLSGNPVVMAAGAAMLDGLTDPAVYSRIDTLAGHLENALAAAVRRAEVPGAVVRRGSMLTLFLRDGAPASFAEAAESDTALFGRFHRGMLDRGVMLPPSQFEAWFVSAAHNEATIDEAAHAAHEALRAAVEQTP